MTKVQSKVELTASDIMSRGVVAIGADEPVGTAAKLMLEHGISSLPTRESVEVLQPSGRGDPAA